MAKKNRTYSLKRLTREGKEETIDYFYLLFIHAALLSHVKKSVNEGKLCDPFAKLIRWHQKGPKKENQMAQIKKMLSCMIVLSESLFFGEEMSHRVLKQVGTIGEFSYLIPFFNDDYTFNHIVIQLIWGCGGEAPARVSEHCSVPG